MVGVSTAVVSHHGADVFRNAAEVGDQLDHRKLEQFGVLLQCPVQLVDVRLMVFRVVNLHGPGVDVRLHAS